jgi:hypothetical protein
MDEQLLPGGGDGSFSQASESLQRSSSLLERIRAQREREARAAAESSNATSNDVEMDSGPVHIPNYAPIASDAVGGGGGGDNSSGSFGFSGFSMNFGGPSSGGQNESSQGLLSEQNGISENGYSMTEYFRMFVGDVYGFFRSLPIPVQAFLIVFLLWVAWKLL